MRKAHVTIDKTFGDIEATFEFDVSKWSESRPYGSTTASEQMAEATCTAIYVSGEGVTEEELQEITEGAFVPDRDWEPLEERALDQI